MPNESVPDPEATAANLDPEDCAAAAAADATADSLAAVLLLGKAAGLLTDTLPVLAAKTLFKVKGVIIPLVTLVVATVEVILALLKIKKFLNIKPVVHLVFT